MSESSFLLIILVGLFIFVSPTVIAFARKHPNRWLILGVNVCLGATGIVWFGCLIWALQAVHLSNDDGSDGGESGLNLFANDETRVRVVGLEPIATSFLADVRSTDHIEKLTQLKKLRDDGALSEEEFSLLKERLLAE
tara:strand:- start:4099 stop:4512 length:414 start_codon:yes stop_codon:yes gene_type:complete